MKSLVLNFVLLSLVLLACIPAGIRLGLKWSHVEPSTLPPSVSMGYMPFKMRTCGPGCEWRRYSDELWELDNWDRGTVARVLPVISFPGHFYVQTNSSVRSMESEWPTLDQAKRHAEHLAIAP